MGTAQVMPGLPCEELGRFSTSDVQVAGRRGGAEVGGDSARPTELTPPAAATPPPPRPVLLHPQLHRRGEGPHSACGHGLLAEPAFPPPC